MLVSSVGSVKLMITNAFELPVTCQAPAVAAVGRTVVATPLMTVPKFKSLSVATVMPTVTTTASAVMDAPDCASARADTVTHAANQQSHFTAQSVAQNHGPRSLEHDLGIEVLALGDDFIAQPIAAPRQSRRRDRAGETWLHREVDADRRSYDGTSASPTRCARTAPSSPLRSRESCR